VPIGWFAPKCCDSWQTSTAKGLVVQNQDRRLDGLLAAAGFCEGNVTGGGHDLPKGSVQTFTNDLPNLPAAHLPRRRTRCTEGQPALRNLLAIAPAEIGKPFVYYLGAGWSESGDFPDAKSWTDYIRRFAERRDQPLQVTIGN
jgi:hypothetical protein